MVNMPTAMEGEMPPVGRCDQQQQRKRPPPGVKWLRRVCFGRERGGDFSLEQYQASVLVLTFIAYSMYHMSRKPPSIVKSVLDPDAHGGTGGGGGWVPFVGKKGQGKLGEVDVAFLAAYALGMYFSGHLGDRLNLRLFLGAGMIGSGMFTCFFGMGYFWHVHQLWYFIFVQVCAGLFQSTGWPSVVTFVANWFGKTRRGLIMGIWNAHTSVGNILGALLPAAVLHWGWGWSFVFPGIIIMLGGVMVIAFLPVEPEEVDLPPTYARRGERGVGGVEEERDVYVVERGREGHQEAEAGLLDDGAAKGKGVLVRTSTSLRLGEREDDGHDDDNDDDNDDPNQPPPPPPVSDLTMEKKRVWPAPAPEPEEDAAAEEKVKLGNNCNYDTLYVDEHLARESIGFLEAWRIPGVAAFAFCLFFSKLVAYTFLYWLPFYVKHTEISGRFLTDAEAGDLSTLFDFGGILGGVIAGYLSDKFNMSALVATVFLYLSIPALYAYFLYGSVSFVLNIGLMLTSGLLVNGPYALITTAVSADLGTHESLRGNAKALATVTAIIDGTGSIGAALGPLVTGFMSQLGEDEEGWKYVFWMLMTAALVAGLLLTKLVVAEVRTKIAEKRLYRVLENDELGALVKRLLSESS